MDSIHVYKLLLGFFTPAARAQATEYTARTYSVTVVYAHTTKPAQHLNSNGICECFVIAFSFVILARTVRFLYDV